MEKLGMPLDLTHTSDQTFAEAADLFGGRIYSSHTCCRSLQPIPRNHSDEQLKAILERDGVIGLPMMNYFLKQGYKETSPKEDVTYADVADHVDHICQLAGNSKQVAIGSDCDGGFGREYMPAELDTHRDLVKLGETLSSRGYSEDDIALILSGNWLRFFAETLP
jgi:membrane dipeptidase